MSIKIGCCGFQEARTKYYEEFPLVEIQQTFFQPPPVGTAMKWRSQAPHRFEFSVKAWQLITHEPVNSAYPNLREKLTARAISGCGHFKPTRMVFDAWRRTEMVADALKASIIIFQTPKTFRPIEFNIKNFRNFFRRINRRKFQIVWEPGAKWPMNTVKELCKELNLIYTAEPLQDTFINIGPIQYCRLKGKRGFRSRYDEQDFKKLMQLDQNGTPTYVIFNNASMLFDARNFVRLIQTTAPTESTPAVESDHQNLASQPAPDDNNGTSPVVSEVITSEAPANGQESEALETAEPDEVPVTDEIDETVSIEK